MKQIYNSVYPAHSSADYSNCTPSGCSVTGTGRPARAIAACDARARKGSCFEKLVTNYRYGSSQGRSAGSRLGAGPVEELGSDIVEGIRRIKAKGGPDLIELGSSTLTPVLLEHELADEVLLLVFPVLLGRRGRHRRKRWIVPLRFLKVVYAGSV
ncbi:MAG: dihydrofolate reductase family protein [Verrucomicrobia bacterium]|nr:dihydrofolate reductase family protein [Verrucomicrobiota bacterium]